LLAAPLRGLVRSLLRATDRLSPSLSELVKVFVRLFEQLSGVRLLPASKRLAKNKAATQQAIEKSAGAAKKKSKKTRTTVVESTSEAAAQADDQTAAATRKKSSTRSKDAKATTSKSSSSSSTTSTSTAPPSTAAKEKKPVKKVSKQAQKHVDSKIPFNNPNYRIQRELKEFVKDPPPNLTVNVGANLRVWLVTLKGAKGTIYEGETFQLRIKFPDQYPTVPPSVYFLPPNIPVHEHVYTNGDICLSLLGKDWRPTMTAQSIAVSILSILSSAQSKCLPMDNARHAQNKPGEYQKDWVYHDDQC
jgi:ubiquitin-conjugating enzyme E2 W